MKATVEIKKLNLLSLATALKLFTIKVAPIAKYGIQLIWNHITYSNLKRLEGVKTAFLKRMLSVSKYTPNRITYNLADTTFFIEDLMAAHNLVPNPPPGRQEAEIKKCTPRTSQHSCNDKQRMETCQLPAAPPVH